jgi:prepilin-type N-terminal cleavage/methylation domain-containing protein
MPIKEAEGFTLLELVVVVTVIAILAGTLVYGIPKWQEQARLAAAVEMGNSIQQGTIAYCAQNSNTPTSKSVTEDKIPRYVRTDATSWNALTINGAATPVIPAFAGTTCGNDPERALISVTFNGGCVDESENIVYNVAQKSATCQ